MPFTFAGFGSADGEPQWWEGYTIPTVSISYYDTIALVRDAERGPLMVEVAIQTRTFASTSQNVIGEEKGIQRPAQYLVTETVYGAMWAPTTTPAGRFSFSKWPVSLGDVGRSGPSNSSRMDRRRT